MKIDCAYDELVDIHKLVPNPKNPNKHTKEQTERLAKIIDFQGQRQPIVVSNRSGFIVKGHGRLEAIKLLGWDKCAVDYQDYKDEAQEYADMVADNEIAKWAEQDQQMILEEISNLDVDIDMLGMVELKGIEDCEADMPELASGDREPFQQMSFTLADGQAEIIKEAVGVAKKDKNYDFVEKMGNENSNGNALFMIVQEWLNGRR